MYVYVYLCVCVHVNNTAGDNVHTKHTLTSTKHTLTSTKHTLTSTEHTLTSTKQTLPSTTSTQTNLISALVVITKPRTRRQRKHRRLTLHVDLEQLHRLGTQEASTVIWCQHTGDWVDLCCLFLCVDSMSA